MTIDLYGYATRENCFGESPYEGDSGSFRDEPTDEDLEGDDEEVL